MVVMIVMSLAPARGKIGVDSEGRIEVETTEVEDIAYIGSSEFDNFLWCASVQRFETPTQRDEIIRGNEVDLRNQQPVRKAHLRLRLVMFVQLRGSVLRIDHCHDAIERKVLFNPVVRDEGLYHGRWIRKTGCFDQHVIKLQFS